MADRPGAHLLAWMLIGFANLIVTWLSVKSAGLGRLITQHAYDLGHALALGVASFAVAAAWRRWGPRARWPGYLALALFSVGLAQSLLKPDLWSLAGRLSPEANWSAAASAAAALLALIVPASLWLGSWLPRKIGPHPVWVLALVLAVGHQLVLGNLYIGLHGYLTWCAALLGVGGMAPLSRWLNARFRRHGRLLTVVRWSTLLALAAAALLIRTPRAVRTQMLQVPGSVMAQWSHLLVDTRQNVDGLALLAAAPGAGAQRAARPDTPATPRQQLPWLPDAPIVVVVAVDAMRADLLDKHAEQLPAMAQLRREGVYFPHAWSTSPATSASVASLWSGCYASQLIWTPKKVRSRLARFPHIDPTPRVAELFGTQGVRSAVATHMGGMSPSYGLTKGFVSQLPSTRAAHDVAVAWKQWISANHEHPSLSYLHFIDAHRPYSLAGPDGGPYQRYVREVALADSAIAEMRSHIDELGIGNRVIFVLTADHGEAFGEHNSNYHGSSVYEEQVRIPLLIHHPEIGARRVDAQVSLVDVAPTLLDVFNVATPGKYMGISLLVATTGGSIRRERPLWIDSPHYAAMVFEDWTKLVVHESGALALYDLRADPAETVNIMDDHPAAPGHWEALRQFVLHNDVRPFLARH